MRWLLLGVVSAAFWGLSVFGDELGAARDLVAGGLQGAAARTSDPPGRDAPAGRQALPADDYITAPVERGTIQDVVTATGTVRPVETVEIGSQIAGEVARLMVDFNSEVHRGDTLAELDQRTFRAKLDEQRSALEVTRESVQVQLARLERARIDLDNARAGQGVLEARIESARAQVDVADAVFGRQQILKSHSSVATATVEAAQMELVSRTALLKEASSALDQHAYTIRGFEADVRRLEAELAQTRAELPLREAGVAVAQIDLDRTVIRSPIDGVVVGRFISRGQTLAENIGTRSIFTIARDLGEMEIHAKVDETDIGRLRTGQRAAFSVDAYPNRRFEAVVRQVRKAAEVSQNVVTYTVVLTTDNRGGLLLPGMTALVRVTVNQADAVLKVPLAALRFTPAAAGDPGDAAAADPAPAVWLVGPDGRLKRVRVSTGASTDGEAALTAGALAESDRVVVGEASRPPERRFLGVRLGF